jgi:hypothetical protein
MDANFIIETDTDGVEKAALEWVERAETGRMYSMENITREIYGADFDTDEFWRTCVNIGPVISQHGFKRIHYRSRRFWIKTTSGHNATLTRGAQTVDKGDAGSPSR